MFWGRKANVSVIIGISNGYHLLLDQPASTPNIVHELNTCHVNKNIHLLSYLLSIISLILDSVKSFAGPDLKVPYPSIPDWRKTLQMVSSSPPLRVLFDCDGKHRKWSAVVPHLVFCFPKVEAFGTATNTISFDRVMEQMEVQNIQRFLINDDGKVFVIILWVFTHNCGNQTSIDWEQKCFVSYYRLALAILNLQHWLQECYLEYI